ncbi:hypothetical protein MVLG_02321 [Microbotryum lychnidis-dioicae p1A1 Lamole]|uniref:Uncharacterized protein n=1 Tax=Microbotryum lychnidis-dioicae (strain p1A1 Lamole / MvSl-1064) TaxID=683840 RepID=U5H4T5_USTV1|nr:hypothetical protein MVLG_02321 [Microbotryum lychnidis-dioicae p1A1 Lamole]|eukprot:KDE07456.1 hypothetical protein MVLG_02321 [Microbotryum lychnidis-dioicae p1A1 Lamole]
MLVPIAFTGPDFEEQYATSHFLVHPLVDVMMDLAQHALTQPTRLFAPGLAVVDGDAYLVVLDRELCRVAEIADCWGAGFGVFAAVLSTLFGLDIYSSGFSSLFRYECCRETGLTPVSFYTRFLCEGEDAGVSGVRVALPSSRRTSRLDSIIVGSDVNALVRTPDPARSQRLQRQWGACAWIDSFAPHKGGPRPRNDPLRRTLDLLLLRNPTAELPRPVSEPVSGLRQVYQAFDQLLAGLSDFRASGIHHRDLSLGNILHHDGHLVLIDWDVGAVGASVLVAALEGGLLSMSLAIAPSSSMYWFVTVLRYHVATKESVEVWDDMWFPPP